MKHGHHFAMGHQKVVRNERVLWSLDNTANLHALTKGPRTHSLSRTVASPFEPSPRRAKSKLDGEEEPLCTVWASFLRAALGD